MTCFLIVDALAHGSGLKRFTRDVIGAGPRTVAGVLESCGYPALIIPAELPFKKSKKKQKLLKKSDVLLISAMTMDRETVKRFVKFWRKIKQNAPVLVGGSIASDPKTCLKIGADIVVIGEGETTLKELLKHGLKDGELPSSQQLDKILGIGFKSYEDNQKKPFYKINPLRPASSKKEFNSFKVSTICIKDYPNYNAKKVYVEIVRGCSNYYRAKIGLNQNCKNCEKCRTGPLENRFNCPENIPPGCGFCSIPSLFGPARSKDLNLIVEEIKALASLGCRRIVLSAPDFLDYGRDALVYPHPLTDPRTPQANVETLENLLKEVSRFDTTEISIENIKPCLFTEETAKIISKYLPETSLNIGCETGCPDHAEKLGRPSTPKEALNTAEISIKYGLKPHVYFIHSLPGQNSKTVKKTVRIIKKLGKIGVDKITVYRFKPLPMSAFHSYPKPPAAIHNRESQMIVEAAKEVNIQQKKHLIGKPLEVLITEQSFSNPSIGVGRPIKDGPLIAVKDAGHLQGKKVNILVTEIISDRLLGGKLIKNRKSIITKSNLKKFKD